MLFYFAIFYSISLYAEVWQATPKTLPNILLSANNGDTISFSKDTYYGPITIAKSLILQGNKATFDGKQQGKVLIIDAPKVIVENLTISGSGSDLRGPDSGIYLTPKATGTIIRNNSIQQCTFGIWVHTTHNVTIEKNNILGSNTGNPSNRGNGIHLFDAKDLVIKNNRIRYGRDGIYISATENSLIEYNHMSNTRYGIHYMYSYSNELYHNKCDHNINGYALMASHHLVVKFNVAKNNERHALLFRDVQYCTIEENHLEDNGEGMFFFSSTENTIQKNKIIRNDVGMKIWAGSLRNVVSLNQFIANKQQVFYVGSTNIDWGKDMSGNIWSDYMGWDQNDDGLGDRPYRVNSFNSKIIYQYPSSRLLMQSPTMELLGLLEHKIPVLQSPTIIDHSPIVKRQNP